MTQNREINTMYVVGVEWYQMLWNETPRTSKNVQKTAQESYNFEKWAGLQTLTVIFICIICPLFWVRLYQMCHTVTGLHFTHTSPLTTGLSPNTGNIPDPRWTAGTFRYISLWYTGDTNPYNLYV